MYTSLWRRSTLTLWTDLPVSMLPLPRPLCSIMKRATSTFSSPWSLLVWEESPHRLTPPLNRSRSVDAKLFLVQYKYTISRLYPSIHAWTTSLQWISLWWPSMCDSAFGLGTLHFLRYTTWFQRRAVPTGSIFLIISRVLERCTCKLLLLNAPIMRLWPILGVTDLTAWMTMVRCSSEISVNPLSTLSPNSSRRLLRVLSEILSNLAILTQRN